MKRRKSRLAGGALAGFASSRLATVIAYAACVLIWGTTWLAIKVSLHGMPPIFGAGVRFVIAGSIMYAFAFARGVDFRRATPPLHLVAVLAFAMFGLNYALTYVAETHLASGLVAVLFGTMPFFIFGFAWAMIGERADGRTIAGASLALGGVATISLVAGVRGDLLYIAAALVASASSGFANVYLKRFAAVEPLVVLPPAMLLAGTGLAVLGLGSEHVDVHRAMAAGPLAALFYLAVCGSAIAFYCNHWLLQRITSGSVGLTALMVPVIAVAVGALFGGEVFGMRDIIGALLVIGGVWLSLGRATLRNAQVSPSAESQAVA